AEIATSIALSISIYGLMKYFLDYMIVRVVVFGEDEKLRRVVTDQILAGGKPLDGFPENMADAVRHKCYIGRDEYTFLEMLGDPVNYYNIYDLFDAAIFIIDCSTRDQQASLDLFERAMRLGTLNNIKFMIYALESDTSENISESDIKEIYGLERFIQQWYIQPVETPRLRGIEHGIKWIR
ncbi:hypothetical protein PENTCL1PPCAC_13510, partial [Pristionchus entomophagus]